LKLALEIWQFEKKKILQNLASLGLVEIIFFRSKFSKNSSKIKDTARRWK
jgi:16S rRNA U1498 N3-methylase RsmE